MKLFVTAVVILILAPCFAAHAETHGAIAKTLEEKIAYQQGQFGSLYAQCGSFEEKGLIGGSLDAWRKETFHGFHGSAEERADLEKFFQQASADVESDPKKCDAWVKQAASTWRSISYLSRSEGRVISTHP